MKAILLSKENRDKILEDSDHVSPDQLDAMIGEYSPRPPGMRLYFCPDFNNELGHWGSLPEDFLYHHYVYDLVKIDTEFVEITEKNTE